MTREKELIECDLLLRTKESQQVMRENEQLQTAYVQSQQQVEQFRQEVGHVIIINSIMVTVVMFSSPAVNHETR